MMSFSEILFLCFIASAWTAPVTLDIDASPESMDLPEPTPLDNITTSDQNISVTWPQKPIAELLNLNHQGIHTIRQVADRSYQKLLIKAPQVNFQYVPYNIPISYPVLRQIPVSTQSIVSVPVLLPQRMFQSMNHVSTNNEVWNRVRNYINLHFNKNSNVASIAAQIDPLPVVPPDWVNGYQSSSSANQTSNVPSIWEGLEDLLNKFTNNNQNKHNGNRTTREVIKNTQNLVAPRLIQEFLSIFTNQDRVEGTTASPEINDESSESEKNHSGSTMTTSEAEVLPTTTDLPTEFESTTTTTFDMTTEIPATRSNEEEIILSTTQSELLDKNAEIDEAIAFNIDGGDISSTQESATQFPKINKDNFYVIYERPTLTKKDNSLLLNTNVRTAVALNESDIKDLKITNVA